MTRPVGNGAAVLLWIIRRAWNGRVTVRGDAKIGFALFAVALSASLPVGALYWLMRPMALPNPGISTYQAPRSDPTISRGPSDVYEAYALSTTAVKRGNERPHAKSRSGFSARAHVSRRNVGVAMVQQTRQRSARKHYPQSPWPAVRESPGHFWAFRNHEFGMWYR